MIIFEGQNHIPNYHEKDSNHERTPGFFDLLHEQDALNERIREIRQQLYSIDTNHRNGGMEDPVRKESLEAQLAQAEEELNLNQTRLGSLNQPDIEQ